MAGQLTGVFLLPVSLWTLPDPPHIQPSSGKEQGERERTSLEGGLSGLGFMSALIVFFLLLSNSTLNQLQGENQGSETLTNLPKVTQLESSRLRLEAGYDNLQGLCPPPALPPSPPASVDVFVRQVTSVATGQPQRGAHCPLLTLASQTKKPFAFLH